MVKKANLIQPTPATILENLLDGVLIICSKGKIKYANKSASQLFNATTNQLIGGDFGFVIKPHQVQEIHLVQKEKLLFVQMLATTIEWEQETAILVSLRDITELKKLENHLQLERQNLLRSNTELSHYASMASHDLKEPVRKVLLFANRMLREFKKMDPEAKELTEKIHKSASRLSSLIEGITKLHNIKKRELVFSTVDLNQLVKDVIEDLESLIIEKKVHIKVSRMPWVHGDPNLLHQLFLNLISNAIKYSSRHHRPYIHIHGKSGKRKAIIAVQDNGIGFDNMYSTKVFEPFQRLHTEGYQGSGMGLAICKKIVEAHKGNISVKSKPDSGSKFSIEIPVTSRK